MTDPDEYRNCVGGTREAFGARGAQFPARGGRHQEVEAALDCYDSPEYQAARRLRREAGLATVALVEGA